MSNELSRQDRDQVPLMDEGDDSIVLFHPHVSERAIGRVTQTLRTRWIGQGPQVEHFERRFCERFCEGNPAIGVGSGTDALHLAYLLAGLTEGDEVISPVFTCTATNIPFLYMGVHVRFADVQRDTFNIDVDHVRTLITDRTRAIVCVHYAGLPCDLAELHELAAHHGIPVIEDAAHALGAMYRGRPIGAISDFTMFSFQAVKHITTGDGGMLTFRNAAHAERARRLRWFGIDRSAKHRGIWDNNITDVGYKYQMTDVAAAMGLAGLDDFDQVLAHRQALLAAYRRQLEGVSGISLLGTDRADRTHASWLCTALVEERPALQAKLHEHRIESSQVHFRNDRYAIFGERRPDLPNMDAVENHYLVLPLHTKLNIADVDRICDVIRSGW